MVYAAIIWRGGEEITKSEIRNNESNSFLDSYKIIYTSLSIYFWKGMLRKGKTLSSYLERRSYHGRKFYIWMTLTGSEEI